MAGLTYPLCRILSHEIFVDILLEIGHRGRTVVLTCVGIRFECLLLWWSEEQVEVIFLTLFFECKCLLSDWYSFGKDI